MFPQLLRGNPDQAKSPLVTSVQKPCTLKQVLNYIIRYVPKVPAPVNDGGVSKVIPKLPDGVALVGACDQHRQCT